MLAEQLGSQLTDVSCKARNAGKTTSGCDDAQDNQVQRQRDASALADSLMSAKRTKRGAEPRRHSVPQKGRATDTRTHTNAHTRTHIHTHTHTPTQPRRDPISPFQKSSQDTKMAREEEQRYVLPLPPSLSQFFVLEEDVRVEELVVLIAVHGVQVRCKEAQADASRPPVHRDCVDVQAALRQGLRGQATKPDSPSVTMQPRGSRHSRLMIQWTQWIRAGQGCGCVRADSCSMPRLPERLGRK